MKEEIREVDKKDRSNWKAWGQVPGGGRRGGEINGWRGEIELKTADEMWRNGKTDGC